MISLVIHFIHNAFRELASRITNNMNIGRFHITSWQPYYETVAMLVYQTNPVGVELFSYVNTSFCVSKFACV